MTNSSNFDYLNTGPFSAARVLAAMLDHPTLAVAAVRRGRVLRANASWVTLFGIRDDAPIEPSVTTLFPGAQSAERFQRAIQQSFDKGVARVEHLLMRADGVSFMAEVVVHLLADDETLDADAVWQVRDITAERDLRREVRELEEYYRALNTHQWDLTFVVDADYIISYVSPSVEATLGFRGSEMVGERAGSFLHPEELLVDRERFNLVVAGDVAAQREIYQVQVRHRDGGWRVLSCRQRNCLDVPRINGVVINARDVTEEARRNAERDAERDRHLARSTLLRTSLFDLATAQPQSFAVRIAQLLQAALDTLNVSSASFWRGPDERGAFFCEFARGNPAGPQVDSPLGQSCEQSDAPVYYREILHNHPIVVDDVRSHAAVTPDNGLSLLEANVGAMLDFPVARGGATVGFMSIEHGGGSRQWDQEEISFAAGLSLLIALALESEERAAAAARTEYMALHDSLTGLVNRNGAELEISRIIEAARKANHRVAVLLLDLDHFKEINDTFGHHRGDELLCRAADILRACTGDAGVVARMGGDEFLIVVRNADQTSPERLAHNLIDRISTEHLLPGIEQHVGASIGVVLFPLDGTAPGELLANADVAMYQAKERGRNQHFVFNAVLGQRLRLQRDLDTEIRDALKRREFSLFYQPQVNLADGAIIGLEALLRWEHPRRGLLLPSLFMAPAEHNGLIDTITKWAISEACEQNIAWQRAGLDALTISVNITGRQFHDRHLPAIVASALMKTGLPARYLMLEVTEESLIEKSATTEKVLAELKQIGIGIAIDDFGVGYSSLSYLRRLVVNQIKLDKAFIEGLPQDGDSSAIIAAVIAIARRLNYQVVAEGIETEVQATHLRSLGCEAGQGFLFGAPLSASEIEAFLREHARH